MSYRPSEMWIDPNSDLYQIGISVSDRLGRHANVDNGWFDSNVLFWRGRDGIRLTTNELSDLGGRVVDWIVRGNLEIPASIFDEVEEILLEGFGSDRGSTERGYCIEFLWGLDAAMADRRQHTVAESETVKSALASLMGDETKLVWAQARSQA